jgi:hypothetical protein
VSPYVGLKPDAVGTQSVRIHEYVVRERDGLWEVRLEGRLLSGQSTQMRAYYVAEALAHAAALRGKRSKVLVGDLDGGPIEFPTVEPQAVGK